MLCLYLLVSVQCKAGHAASFPAQPFRVVAVGDGSGKGFQLTLLLFTHNRIETFKRLWRSVEGAKPVVDGNVRVSLTIVWDFDPDFSDKDRAMYRDFLTGLQSKHGAVKLIEHKSQQGLKKNIVETWQPTSLDEYAIFLEDDIEVSVFFLDFAVHYIQAYFYGSKTSDSLFGISLYNVGHNEVLEETVTVDNGNLPYAYQQPQSWGGVYAAQPWKMFAEFVKELDRQNVDPLIPDSYTNRWPGLTSWKKYMFRFMYLKGYFLIYPNLPSKLSFSTNHIEVGANTPPQAKKALLDKLYRPLLSLKFEDARKLYWKTPELDQLQVYDMYHNQVSSLQALNAASLKHPVDTFDKCTLITQVHDKLDSLHERISYYQNITGVDSVVVVVNEPATQTNLLLNSYMVPVHVVRPETNSRNNRFYPWPEIQTDCVVSIDGDLEVDHEHVLYAIRLWKGHFWDNLVGFLHQARNHMLVDGEFYYCPEPIYPEDLTKKKIPFFSIMLPSVVVFHRRWMHEYTFNLPRALLDKVDADGVGEDILFNIMIANSTGQGPVVVDAPARPFVKHCGDQLSKTECFVKQTEFLQAAVAAFGHMPLRYTTSLFKINWEFVQGKHHHSHQIPTPQLMQCTESSLVDEKACIFSF